MACTRSTCRGKRKRDCCTRSSSSNSLIKTKRHCLRRDSHAPPLSPFPEGSQSHCNWSNIGVDVLEHAYKWLSLADILRCRAVCSWWRSISQTHISSFLNSPTTPPILWHQCYPIHQYFFLKVAKDAGNLYFPNHESILFLDQMKRCVGHSLGYILLIHKNERNRLCLLRPLSSTIWTVRFPPISVPGEDGIRRAVLWADPISAAATCGVVVVPSKHHRLLFAKFGDRQFAELECQELKRADCCREIVCINNCVYGISKGVKDHYMEAWDCSSCGEDGPRKVLDFQPTFSSWHVPSRLYTYTFKLLESKGELLLVAIHRFSRSSISCRIFNAEYPACMVYKMDFKEKKWVRISSLGDRALFIFCNQRISLSSLEFPHYRKNTIYFWQWKYRPERKNVLRLGVFDMEDGSLKRVYPKKS